MTTNGDSLPRPYEVIETEETVTRYFKPSQLKVPTNSSKNNPRTRTPYRHHEIDSLHQFDTKIAKDDRQLQVLYEKFNKMRMVMSELTEKFKEINSALPPSDEADVGTVTDLSSTGVQKTKSKDDLMDSHDDVLEDSRDYKPLVGVDADHNHTRASKQQVIGDCEAEGCQTKLLNDINHKRVDCCLLKRSKTLLIRLIDKELQRLQPSKETRLPENIKHLKVGCIDRIGEELAVLKDLEVIEDVL